MSVCVVDKIMPLLPQDVDIQIPDPVNMFTLHDENDFANVIK